MYHLLKIIRQDIGKTPLHVFNLFQTNASFLYPSTTQFFLQKLRVFQLVQDTFYMLNSKIWFIFLGHVWFLRYTLFLFQRIFRKYCIYPSVYGIHFCKTASWVNFNKFLDFFFCLDIIKLDRKCKNHPNKLCYVCRHVVLPERQVKITDFMNRVYQADLGVKLGYQDKQFVPHICSTISVENLQY